MAKIDRAVRQPANNTKVEPRRTDVNLERSGSLVVAVPRGCEPPTLTASEVAAVIDEVRTGHDRDGLLEQLP